MIDRHTYAATLLEGAGYALAPEGGTVTMDESWAPYLQADLTIPIPSEAVQELIDPRVQRRVRIDCTVEYPGSALPTLSRSFNLGLRSRRRGLVPGTISLALASDEALLMDNRLVSTTPDTSATANQNSLRAIVNGVLARIGAQLQPGTADTPFRVLESSTNLIRNPRVGTNTTDWNMTWTTGGLNGSRQAAGGPADSPTYYAAQASAATTGGYVYLTEAAIPVQGNKAYTLSAWVQAGASLVVGIDGFVFNAGSAVTQFTPQAKVTPAGTWKRVSVTFTTPADATKIRPRFFHDGTLPAGSYINVTGWRLAENTGYAGIDYAAYFDGDTPSTSEYGYAWSATAHASTSRRTALIDRSPELLAQRPGQSDWEFLSPLVQAAGFRLFCDELRRWFMVDGSTYIAPGALQFSTDTNLTAADDTIDRDGGEWFDGAVVTYRWTDRDGTQQEKVDAYAEPGATHIETFTIEHPYPGPGFAKYAVKRSQGKGRTLDIEAASLYSVTPSQPITVTTPATPIQTGVVKSVKFRLDDDEMAIATRGLTDTPPGSWLFGAPGKRWADVPAGKTYANFDWSF